MIIRAGRSEARRSVDLSRETAISLQFWAKADAFEPESQVGALVCSRDCADDANWTTVKSWSDGVDDIIYRPYGFAIPSDMLTREFWIRFQIGLSDTPASLFIDDVKFVSPMPGPTPTPTPTPTPRPAPAPTPIPTRQSNIQNCVLDTFSIR